MLADILYKGDRLSEKAMPHFFKKGIALVG